VLFSGCAYGKYTDGPWRLAEEECEMANSNGKSRANFRWVLSCATIGTLVSISTALRAADLGAQEMQRLGTAPPEVTPFTCDSLDPRVCFDICQRRTERIRVPRRSDDQEDNGVLAVARRLERCLSMPNQFGMLTPQGWLTPMRSDYCSSITNIR
jgi:hypothetical protein